MRSHRNHFNWLRMPLAVLLLLSMFLGEAGRAEVAASSAGPTWSLAAGLDQARWYHGAALLNDGRVLITGGWNHDGLLDSADIYDPAKNTWTAAAKMATTRRSHISVVLPNGRVMVIGGATGTPINAVYLRSVELYDPLTNTWAPAADLNHPRAYFTATPLPDGKVLVYGGFAHIPGVFTGRYNNGEIYDPVANTWTLTSTATIVRAYHTATLLTNGKVLIAGGNSSPYPMDPYPQPELYDPATNVWSPAGTMNRTRSNHMAVLLPNGKVLAAGGYYNDPNLGTSYISSAELYDPIANNWQFTGAMSTSREGASAHLLPNGKVLLVSGYGTSWITRPSGEIYDPASGTWSLAGTMTEGRHLHTSTLLPDGRVLTVGGLVDAGLTGSAEIFQYGAGEAVSTSDLGVGRANHAAALLTDGRVLVSGGSVAGVALGHSEIYNPSSGSWSSTGSLASNRAGHTLTLLSNQMVLAVGGMNGSGYLATSERYTSSTSSWANAASLNTARSGHTATPLFNGKMLVVGGENSMGALASAELYDPVSDAWTRAATMGSKRSGHTASLLPNGNVLVVGGSDGTAPLASAEIYHPATNTWSAAPGLAAARLGHAAVSLPDGDVLVSGGLAGATYLTSAERYDADSGTWSPAGSLLVGRSDHTASLLMEGFAVVVGGKNQGGILSSVEMYDPNMNVWTPLNALGAGHAAHTATLLLNGNLLVVGGGIGGTASTRADLYNLGLGYLQAARPVITNAPKLLAPGNAVAVTGTTFRGITQGGSGFINSSDTGFPLLKLRSLENGQTLWLGPDSTGWSATAFTSRGLPAKVAGGYALLTVVTNGVPSAARLVYVDAAAPEVVGMVGPIDLVLQGSNASIEITYRDNIALDVSTFDGNDIRVTGPNGYDQPAALVSITPPSGGALVKVVYRFPAPGGTWDNNDNGLYSVILKDGQVRDSMGLSAAGKTVGSFNVQTQFFIFLPAVLR